MKQISMSSSSKAKHAETKASRPENTPQHKKKTAEKLKGKKK